MTPPSNGLSDASKIEQLKKELDEAHGQLAALQELVKSFDGTNDTISALAGKVAITQFAIQAVARLAIERKANLIGEISTAVASVIDKSTPPAEVEALIEAAFRKP